MTRTEQAVENKTSGNYNCAQAVACAFCDLVGMDLETTAAATSAYGLGMGNMEGTCGAISGAGLILGLKIRDRNLSRAAQKQLMEKFQQRNGATRCRDLKGIGTGKILRPCDLCVRDAAEFLEEMM